MALKAIWQLCNWTRRRTSEKYDLNM